MRGTVDGAGVVDSCGQARTVAWCVRVSTRLTTPDHNPGTTLRVDPSAHSEQHNNKALRMCPV